MSKLLRAGDRAPEFTLKSASGNVSLSDFRGKKAVVLFFYPKDQTPGCTKEACDFRDSYDRFVAAGAEVIGVSDDSVGSHEKFAGKHSLQMTLLSDEGGAVRSRFGVTSLFGVLPNRVTFVIDRDGIIRHVFESRLQFGKHVTEALETVRALAPAAAPPS